MSIYLYGFQPKAHSTPTFNAGPLFNAPCSQRIDLYCLTFRTANATSTHEQVYVERILNRLDRTWDGRTMPWYFVEGKRRAGGEVFRATEPIGSPAWFDCDKRPGRAEPIGVLVKIGGRYAVRIENEEQRRDRQSQEVKAEQELCEKQQAQTDEWESTRFPWERKDGTDIVGR